MKNKWLNINGVLIALLVFSSFLLSYYDINSNTGYIIKAINLFLYPALTFTYGKLLNTDKKVAYKLGIIYIIYNLIFLIVNYNQGINILIPYHNTWFILCLLIYTIIPKSFYNTKGMLIFSSLLAILIGFYPDFNEILSLSKLLVLFPFYIFGYTFNDKLPLKRYQQIIIGIICLIVLALGAYYLVTHYYISSDILNYAPYLSKKHAIFRLGIFIISLFSLLGLYLTLPNKKIPFISSIGENSIMILCLSYPIILIINSLLNNLNVGIITIISAIIIIILLYKPINDIIKKGFNYLLSIYKVNKLLSFKTVIIMILIMMMIIPNIKVNYNSYPIYNTFNKEELNNTLDIAFVGDLILLENEIKKAYNEEINDYNFDEMFKYTTDYLTNADYAIGVLEGPVTGNNDYTIGNFDDGINIYLNYPTTFINAIQKSGIDLVTTANNHILDKGIDGAHQTIKTLDSMQMNYVGSYENQENRIKYVDIEGLKCAFLAYTYGSNYYQEDELINYDITPLIVDPTSKNFADIKNQVAKDFESAKANNSDLIIVLAHMGTQFAHEPDNYQKTWNKIFHEYGADIVFGDHSHSVQNIEYIDDTLIINSPGNYVNSYVDYDGDASAITYAHIDKTTKKVVASSIVPMYALSSLDTLYTPIPIYQIMTDNSLRERISNYEFKRIKDVQNIITNTMLNTSIDISKIEKQYYYFKDGYKRQQINKTDLSMFNDKKLYNTLKSIKTACFIGDSITAGTLNGGYGWYEPLVNYFNIESKRVAKGSITSKEIANNYKSDIENCQADLYFIAIGTNDVRYRDPKVCAMNTDEYITNIESIINYINPNEESMIILISPWHSLSNDTQKSLNIKEKEAMLNEYGSALKKYADENKYIYINPNPFIFNTINTNNPNKYMVDYIHPNSSNGINLYSYSIMYSAE